MVSLYSGRSAYCIETTNRTESQVSSFIRSVGAKLNGFVKINKHWPQPRSYAYSKKFLHAIEGTIKIFRLAVCASSRLMSKIKVNQTKELFFDKDWTLMIFEIVFYFFS